MLTEAISERTLFRGNNRSVRELEKAERELKRAEWHEFKVKIDAWNEQVDAGPLKKGPLIEKAEARTKKAQARVDELKKNQE